MQQSREVNPTEEEDDALDRGGEHSARDEEERLISSSDNDHENQTEQQQSKFSLHPAWRFLIVIVSFGIAMIFIKIVVVLVLQYQQQVDQASSQQEQDFTSKYDPIWHNGSDTFGPTVILISLDGFRAEYLQRDLTPNMLEFARTGMRAEYMHPAFPTLTFPNHWTLVTGLHPESHGIVANDFYDPEKKKDFTIADANDPSWFSGEPIWQTVKSQGKIAAATMWPGSTAKGLEPNYVVPYNETVTAKEKMDTVLQWLDMPKEQRPNFICAYIEQTDQQGHADGTDGDQINRVIREMDDAIGYLMNELQARNLFNSIHVIIVSDHGMTNTDNSRVIYYDDILSNASMDWLRGREASPLLNLRFKENAPEDAVLQVYNELVNYTQQTADPPFQVFFKQDVPDRFHYSNNDRITPIVVIPNVGYVLVSHQEWHPSSPKQHFAPKGNHGYDNMAVDMQAVFLAHGPRVDRYYGRHSILAPFHNTEIYSFVCQLLNVKPAPHNGTLHGQFMRIHH